MHNDEFGYQQFCLDLFFQAKDLDGQCWTNLQVSHISLINSIIFAQTQCWGGDSGYCYQCPNSGFYQYSQCECVVIKTANCSLIIKGFQDWLNNKASAIDNFICESWICLLFPADKSDCPKTIVKKTPSTDGYSTVDLRLDDGSPVRLRLPLGVYPLEHRSNDTNCSDISITVAAYGMSMSKWVGALPSKLTPGLFFYPTVGLCNPETSS